MKKILLFITVMALAILCTSALASADSINDVIFTKGGSEVFTLSAGDIAATVNVSVEAETDAFLITSAYEGNRLANVQYESVKLLPAQKKYQGTPVTATAATTSVNAMLWGANYEPIGEMQSLTNVSREIKVTDVVVTNSNAPKKLLSYVDNSAGKIYIEQITDIYTTNYTFAAGDPDQVKPYLYYDNRPLDYASLENSTLSYKLNGTAETAIISPSLENLQKITFTAANGREKNYDIVLEHHIALSAMCFTRESPITQTTGTAYAGAGRKALSLDANYAPTPFGGQSRYTGASFKAVSYGDKDLLKYGEEGKFTMERKAGISGKAADDYAIEFSKKPNDSWVHIQVEEAYSHNSILRQDKYDYSFDFCYIEPMNIPAEESPNGQNSNGHILAPGISSGQGDGQWALQIQLLDSNYDGKADLNYYSSIAEGYGGYGKKIAEIEGGKWHNIRLIIDKDNTEGAKGMIVLNGEVILATDIPSSTNGFDNTYSVGNVFRMQTVTAGSGRFALDNVFRTYSQAKPVTE